MSQRRNAHRPVTPLRVLKFPPRARPSVSGSLFVRACCRLESVYPGAVPIAHDLVNRLLGRHDNERRGA